MRTGRRWFSVLVYGRGLYATSRGRTVEVRVGRFYLFVDLGRLV